MSYSLGVYDLLANIIPGGVYLMLLYLGLIRFGELQTDLSTVSSWYIIAFGFASYVVGMVFDPIAKNLWYQRFGGRISQAEIIAELNKENDRIEFTNEKYDWALLSAYVKQHSSDVYEGTRRMSAIHIMLRNISFAAFLVFVLSICDLFVNGFLVAQVVVGLAALLFSILAYKQARRFDNWHFKSTYHAIAGLKLKAKDLPVRLKDEKKENGKFE